MNMKFKNVKWIVGAIIFCIVAHFVTIKMVHEIVYRKGMTLSFEDLAISDSSRITSIDKNFNDLGLGRPIPFKKKNALGDSSYTWTNQFDQYGASGILVFDANGDGKEDVYLCHNSRSWTRITDSSGFLMDSSVVLPNVLFINQGTDSLGNPVFQSLSELVKENNQYQKEELLIEDLLFPRVRETSLEKGSRYGRRSNVAVAADFNSDGRLDLMVGNEPQGMFWSDSTTQRVLMRFVNPVGRETRYSNQALSAFGMHLLKDYQPTQSIYDSVLSYRENTIALEPEGSNSLYLNMGDKDGDGLPEWKDVSRESNIEGFRTTYGLSVADVDLDGDLDVFVANTMDMDYWIGGSKYWSGGANCLYINQLAETGELKFLEKAASMKVDGVYNDSDYVMPDYYRIRRHILPKKWVSFFEERGWKKWIPRLPKEYMIALNHIGLIPYEAYKPDYLTINGESGERGQISWSSVFQDVNQDGYPDIWVANDMGFLRLYINNKGKYFEKSEHARSKTSGYWMTFVPGDFNNDLHEDLFVGNLGGSVYNHAFATPDPFDMFDPVILNATIFAQFFNTKHETSHALFDGKDYKRELQNHAVHSKILPPDVTIPNNIRHHALSNVEVSPFNPNTINAYEFSWGGALLDLQNDGFWDMYYIGGLYGRGGGLFPITGTNPGRCLVNYPNNKELGFVDLTAEHHLFNIEELNYEQLSREEVGKGYIHRNSPTQNWKKRKSVHSFDRGKWVLQGSNVIENVVNQDMIQLAENGRAVVSADLNQDGFSDIIVRNMGGYDSRSSSARNLNVHVGGRRASLPPHNNNFPSPTNYEPGKTWVYVNQYSKNNWVKVNLLDTNSNSYNRDGVGARVIVNNRILKVKRSGGGSFLSNTVSDLQFGLKNECVTEIRVHWPNKQQQVSKHQYDCVKNAVVTVVKPEVLNEL